MKDRSEIHAMLLGRIMSALIPQYPTNVLNPMWSDSPIAAEKRADFTHHVDAYMEIALAALAQADQGDYD